MWTYPLSVNDLKTFARDAASVACDAPVPRRDMSRNRDVRALGRSATRAGAAWFDRLTTNGPYARTVMPPCRQGSRVASGASAPAPEQVRTSCSTTAPSSSTFFTTSTRSQQGA
jgi:hypothetical protein